MVVFPIVEGRHTLLAIIKSLFTKDDGSATPKGSVDQEKFDSAQTTPDTGSVEGR